MTAYEELRRRAQQTLPTDVFAWYAGGSGDNRTLDAQEAAWQSVPLVPRVLRDVSSVSTATTLLGTGLATPVVVAPTAAQTLAHPQGEVAVASAAREAGSLYVLSMRASTRIETVAQVSGPFWQQIYVLRDRGISDDVARQAAELGATALMVTVDTPYVARKGAGFPAAMPRTGIVSALDDRDFSDTRFDQAADLGPDDLAHLREVTGLPVVAKGVLSAQAARECVGAGASAVVVSAHGGRQLDGVVATPRALAEVSEALAGDVEVYVDGGVRTGSDVLRALALGARAVLLGRPALWALAAGGQAGVRAWLDDLAADVREALALAGCVSCEDVGPNVVARSD